MRYFWPWFMRCFCGKVNLVRRENSESLRNVSHNMYDIWSATMACDACRCPADPPCIIRDWEVRTHVAN